MSTRAALTSIQALSPADCALFAAAVIGLAAIPAAHAQQQITGAGATFPAPVYTKWGEAAKAAARPIDDMRGSIKQRKHLSSILVQHTLRKAAERSVRGLWHRIGSIVQTFSPQECANYFRHAGYAAV